MDSNLNTDVLIVSTLEDENDGDFSAGDLSLREAIAIAENGATINFDSNLSGGTISLTLGELAIDKDLSIQGLGANNLTVNGNNNSSVFNVDSVSNDPDINVNIAELTITGGSAVDGGGIRNRENLTVSNSVISGNSASRNGGAVYTILGATVLDNTVISDNFTNDGSDSSGTVFKRLGSLDINNSIISNNSGSGVFQVEISAEGDGSSPTSGLTIQNSTINDNTGSGIDDNGGSGSIINSTVSGNLSGGIDTFLGVTVDNSTITNNANYR